MQFDLLANDSVQRIPLQEGELVLIENWIAKTTADVYFESLQKTISWEQSSIKIAGRDMRIPRLNAWYGGPGGDYAYSGRRFTPLPWFRLLEEIKNKAQIELNRWKPKGIQQKTFNSALANLYRNGQDSVAWHADDEKELGKQPQIASVSFGESRRFMLKHAPNQKKEKPVELVLNHGSLLLMLGNLQSHWVHCVPKTKHVIGVRLNITFRNVLISS